MTILLPELLFAVDRGQQEGEAAVARNAWMAVAVVAGALCIALLAFGIWAMTQKS